MKIITSIKVIVLLSIFFILIVTGLISITVNESKSIRDKYKEQIGKRFILNKDTLLIIDYSLLNHNFTLSNGTKIDETLLIK